MFCVYCGKEIADNSRFCKFCGKVLKTAAPGDVKSGRQPEPAPQPEPAQRHDSAPRPEPTPQPGPGKSEKKKGGKGKVIAVTVIVVLVLAAAAAFGYYWFFVRADGSVSEMVAIDDDDDDGEDIAIDDGTDTEDTAVSEDESDALQTEELLISATKYEADGTVAGYYEYEYDENDLVTAEVYTDADSGAFSTTDYSYEFYDDGITVKRLVKSTESSYYTTYIDYDEEGAVTGYTVIGTFDNSSSEQNYDADDVLLSEVIVLESGDICTYYYEYGDDGKVSVYTFILESVDESQTIVTYYEYDDGGTVTWSREELSYGDEEYSAWAEYGYDEDGLLISWEGGSMSDVTVTCDGESTGEEAAAIYYYADGSVEMDIEDGYEFVDGRYFELTTVLDETVSYTDTDYDDGGNPLTYRYYNRDDELLYRIENEYGNTGVSAGEPTA